MQKLKQVMGKLSGSSADGSPHATGAMQQVRRAGQVGKTEACCRGSRAGPAACGGNAAPAPVPC